MEEVYPTSEEYVPHTKKIQPTPYMDIAIPTALPLSPSLHGGGDDYNRSTF